MKKWWSLVQRVITYGLIGGFVGSILSALPTVNETPIPPDAPKAYVLSVIGAIAGAFFALAQALPEDGDF